jgi:hypothetical protein
MDTHKNHYHRGKTTGNRSANGNSTPRSGSIGAHNSHRERRGKEKEAYTKSKIPAPLKHYLLSGGKIIHPGKSASLIKALHLTEEVSSVQFNKEFGELLLGSLRWKYIIDEEEIKKEVSKLAEEIVKHEKDHLKVFWLIENALGIWVTDKYDGRSVKNVESYGETGKKLMRCIYWAWKLKFPRDENISASETTTPEEKHRYYIESILKELTKEIFSTYPNEENINIYWTGGRKKGVLGINNKGLPAFEKWWITGSWEKHKAIKECPCACGCSSKHFYKITTGKEDLHVCSNCASAITGEDPFLTNVPEAKDSIWVSLIKGLLSRRVKLRVPYKELEILENGWKRAKLNNFIDDLPNWNGEIKSPEILEYKEVKGETKEKIQGLLPDDQKNKTEQPLEGATLKITFKEETPEEIKELLHEKEKWDIGNHYLIGKLEFLLEEGKDKEVWQVNRHNLSDLLPHIEKIEIKSLPEVKPPTKEIDILDAYKNRTPILGLIKEKVSDGFLVELQNVLQKIPSKVPFSNLGKDRKLGKKLIGEYREFSIVKVNKSFHAVLSLPK